jgi:hypothetical protein
MFFKEITLKRNGLSYNLIHFVFPWIQRFNNFCPHFWLTIAAAVLFPIVLPIRTIYFCGKMVVLGIVKVFEVLGEGLDELAMKSLESKFFSLPLDELAKWLEWNDHSYKGNGWDSVPLPICEEKRFIKIRKMYYKLLGHGSDDLKARLRERIKQEKAELDYEAWKKELVARDEARKKKQALVGQRRRERLEKIEASAKNSAVKLMVFGKIVAAVVILPLCAFLGYHFCLGLGWLWYWIVYGWMSINWPLVGEWSIIGLGFLIAVALGVGIIIGAYKLFAFIPKGSIRKSAWWCVMTQKILLPLGNIIVGGIVETFTLLENYLPKLGEGIASFFSFFWNIFKAWKDKNCPAIIWKD